MVNKFGCDPVQDDMCLLSPIGLLFWKAQKRFQEISVNAKIVCNIERFWFTTGVVCRRSNVDDAAQDYQKMLTSFILLIKKVQDK